MSKLKLILTRLYGAWLVLIGKSYAVPCGGTEGRYSTERMIRQYTILYAANVKNFLFVYKSAKGYYFYECVYENQEERKNLFNVEG